MKNCLIVCFIVAATTALIGLSSSPCLAQYAERQIPIGYLGLEASAGTRTFSLKSDIPELNRLKVIEEGINLSVLAGNEIAIGKLKLGMFRSGKLVREKVSMQEGGLVVNVFPLYILDIKSKLLRPYALATFDISNLQFSGNYALPQPAMPADPPSECECHEAPDLPGCPGAAPLEPPPLDNLSQDEERTDQQLGRVVVTKFDFGAGILVHMPKRNRFVNMFAELKYGAPVGVKAKDQPFNGTRPSGFLMMNFGVSFGIRN